MRLIRTLSIFCLRFCGFTPPLCRTITSSTRELAIWVMLFQFDKRDDSGDRRYDKNDIPPAEMLAIVIAALTLLVATIPLFRCSRFRCWVSSLIPPFVKVYPPLLALPKPIHIYTLNFAILYRKHSEVLSQTPPLQPLLPRDARAPSRLLRFLYLTLSSFVVAVLTPTLLAPIPIPPYTAKIA